MFCSKFKKFSNIFKNPFDLAFSDIWKNKDESLNKEQLHDEDMIRDVKRNEVEDELRRQVDYLMREELDLLKIVSLVQINALFKCPMGLTYCF